MRPTASFATETPAAGLLGILVAIIGSILALIAVFGIARSEDRRLNESRIATMLVISLVLIIGGVSIGAFA